MLKTQFCIFCDASPTNKEDIWPRWIGKYLGRQPIYTHRKTETGAERIFSGLSYNDRAKVVCKTLCNGGWMKGLEDANNPLLKRMFDENFSIRLTSGPSQLSLARWILKTAMMI